MKRNLVKILAMSSLLLTLGACGGNGNKPGPKPEPPAPDPGPQEVEITLGELSNLVDGKWEYEGKTVIVKGAGVYGVYDNGKTLSVGAPHEDGTTSWTGGAQVFLKEAYNFTELTKGLGAGVTVKGVVADVDGHVALQDAELSDVNERKYDETGARIPNTGVGLGMWYLRDRESYDKLGRSDSNVTYEATDFELLSEPAEQYDGSKELEFYVAFPGENPFLDDATNYDRIRIAIPAGIPAGPQNFFHKSINDFFAKFNVGDQVQLDLQGLYSAESQSFEFQMNGLWGFFADAFKEAEETVEVNRSYVNTIAEMADKYINDMPAFAENDRVYRYEFNNLWQYQLEKIEGADLSFVDQSLFGEGGLVVVDAYTTEENAPTLLGIWGAYLQDLGYVPGNENTETKATFRFTDASDVVQTDVKLTVALDETYHTVVEMVFVGRRSETSRDFTKFADAKDFYESKGGITSALPALPASPAITGLTLSWLSADAFQGAYAYEYQLKFAEGAFADTAAYELYASAYNSGLVAAGFKSGFVMTDFEPAWLAGNEKDETTGRYIFWDAEHTYYNETSKELVYVGFTTDIDDKVNGIVLHVLNIKDQSRLFNFNADAVWTSRQAANYVDGMFDFAFKEHGAMSEPQSGYFAFSGAYIFAPNSGDPADLAKSFDEVCVPMTATYLGGKLLDTGYYDAYWTLPSADAEDPVAINLYLRPYQQNDKTYYIQYVYIALSSVLLA